ncbi:IS110 family transposase [Staphylococcus schweitzeri]|uniref:IS110 family transposase n=3 Tax=Staphylococcus schweitzeri TaxID=1654388 RepID=A0A2K4AK14_9STAP|nr:IS110 family transposase [Staphylococcus schweitzeri]MBE2129616.1 IS110 family transposase [Staphylococcus schweitzeri]PNZ50338.1 IS110 family transposase [Staphylococcus schweitzeri]CDR55233.1 ISSep1-like transposase [Staphylococcus schweitzeri]VEE65338.1 Transposase IS116/IS110/IS902 family [Staphylococcus schweitzeri]VEE65412.1 Transposase IS116/IS110/IS902 family [Staphylococcus schweitzeri]
MDLFVGIDVSSEKLDVCFLDSKKHILNESSLGNSIVGASLIKDSILLYQQQYNYDQVTVGLESTSVYSFHPSMFLHEDEELKALDIIVSVINPKKVHRFKQMFDEDKTDRIDAFRIADFLRIDVHQTSLIKQEKYVALQRLTRSRYQVTKQLVECKQHFLENLYYKCNTLTKEVSTSVFGSTMLELFTNDITLDELSKIPLEDFVSHLQKAGKGRFTNTEKLVKSIQKAIRESYRLTPMVSESVDQILSMYAQLIRTLTKQIKTLDKGIEQVVKTMPEAQLLLSIPGIGPVYTAGILAEVGQIHRFTNEAKLAKYAGLYWNKNQSGNFTASNTSLAKTGNHILRYYLIEATNSVRRYVPTFSNYYSKKTKEVPKHKHKRALVLTARKFIRLVDTLLRNHQIYTPERSV